LDVDDYAADRQMLFRAGPWLVEPGREGEMKMTEPNPVTPNPDPYQDQPAEVVTPSPDPYQDAPDAVQPDPYQDGPDDPDSDQD
jgi:hypothetical protein